MKSTRQAIRIAPGEPVPPGFEGEVKPVAEIQPALDKCVTKALVGIEYIIELSSLNGKTPCYHCVLCDRSYYRKYEPKSIMVHLLSDTHRNEYLNRHFSTAMKEIHKYRSNNLAKGILSGIVDAICSAIEDTYGRMVPQIVEHSSYIDNRKLLTKKVYDDKHFDEKLGNKFTDMIDHEGILRQIKRDVSKSDDKRSSISKTSNNSKISNEKNTKAKEPSFSNEKLSSGFEKKGSQIDRQKIEKNPTDISDTSKKQVILDVELARKQYRFMLDSALRDIKDKYAKYDKHPEKHPKYPAEWKHFWKRRSEEMIAAKKDPTNHNFSTEWSLYWVDFVKDLHADEIVDAKIDIKKRLNLPLDFDDVPKKDLTKSPTDKKVEKKFECEPKPAPEIMPELVSESELNEAIEDIDNISSDAESIIAGLQMEGSLDKFLEKEEREDITPDKDEILMDRISEESFHLHDRIENPSAKVIDSDDDFDSYDQRHSNLHNKTKPPSLIQISEDESDGSELNEESLTLIAVLRILTAFEDYLGSLGPKILDLLSKAIALEKVKPNLADEMLMTEANSVLLELCKEKLTGLLLAEIIEKHKIKGVKKSIKNIKAIVKTIDRKVEEKQESEKLQAAVSSLSTMPAITDQHFENLRKLLPSIISSKSNSNVQQISPSERIRPETGQFSNFGEKSLFSRNNQSIYNEQTDRQNQSNVDLKMAQQKLNLEFSFLNPQNSSRNLASNPGGNNFAINRSQNNSSMNNVYQSQLNSQHNFMDQQNNQQQNQFSHHQMSSDLRQQQQKDIQQNSETSFNQRQSFQQQTQRMSSCEQNQTPFQQMSGNLMPQNLKNWNQSQQNQSRNIQQNNPKKRPSQTNVNQCQDNYKTLKMTSSAADNNFYKTQSPQEKTLENSSMQQVQRSQQQQSNRQSQRNPQNNQQHNQQNPRNQMNLQQRGRPQQQRNQPQQKNQQQQRNQSQQQQRNQSQPQQRNQSQQQQRNQSQQQQRNQSQQQQQRNQSQQQQRNQSQQQQQQRNLGSFQYLQGRPNQQNNWQQLGDNLFNKF